MKRNRNQMIPAVCHSKRHPARPAIEMTITSVQTWQPIADNSPPDWRTSLGQIAVSIQTSNGLTGYGVGGGGLSGMHIIREILEPLLVGRDTEPVEEHWEAMYATTMAFGRKGVALMAISGVDLALWDLRAKRAGQSVCELLGGQTKTSLATYATFWDVVSERDAADVAAVKLHVHPDAKQDRVNAVVEVTAQAREVIGPDKPLMLDAWMEWDVETTLDIANRVARYEIDWIEEPLPADWLDEYALLCRESPIPIAGGEHEFTSRAFGEIIDRRAHQVLQPDVCWVGGLTELVRIYELAAVHNQTHDDWPVRVVPHRGCEVWALHAIAALDPDPLAESGRPWMSWVHGQPEVIAGRITPPADSGFGVTLKADDRRGP